jgi:energy-converting hydrogenase Eha subunit E
MFLFFSNKLGWLGSIAVSAILTLLLLLFGVL